MQAVEETKRGGSVGGARHNPDGTPGAGKSFVLQDTGKVIEEEKGEINIPLELRQSKQIHTFTGKNKDILNSILQLAGLSLSDEVNYVVSGDVVICVRSVEDETVRTLTGTVEELIHQINTSNGCKPVIRDPALQPAPITPPLNADGGYQYSGESKTIAKRCGLVTLPKLVPGTNCGNCIFNQNNFCDHYKVILPVTDNMCCAFWDDKSFSSHVRNIWKANFFADKSVQYPLNKEGGYDYTGKALERARHADLITLPPGIKGTNCATGNCMYGQNGLCVHPRIKLPVTDQMSCGWWDNTEVIRTWGKPVELEFQDGGSIPKTEKIKDWQAENPHSPRWKKKKESIQQLSNSIHRLRLKVGKDMQGEDERAALTALIVAVMDRTAERIGNDDSADNGHFGVTGFRKDHIRVVGSKVHLDYVGKAGTKHAKSISDLRISKALKKAIKNSPSPFIFETSDGFRIKSDKVNRYLEQFNISAKDLRGYNANKWIIEELKRAKVTSDDPEKAKKERKKIFNKAVKQTADRVGHGAATLRKHYMIPELPIQYIQYGRIINMKDIGYYLDGGPLGDLRAEDYFENKNEVPEIVNKKTEEIHKESEEEGMDKLFNSQVVKIIEWENIVPTQDFLRSSKWERLKSVPDLYAIGLPWAIEHQGKYYLNDGHHRALEMHERGLPIKAHVYPMETMLNKGGEINAGMVDPVLLSSVDDAALLLLKDGSPTPSEEKKKEAEEMAKKYLDSLSQADIKSIRNDLEAIVTTTIIREEKELNALLAMKEALKAEDKELYEKEKPLPYGPEKTAITDRRDKIYFELDDLNPLILHQENIIKALKNGGDLSSFTDKKGLEHTRIPFFSNIKTDNIAFDEETILTDAVPPYIPNINEEVFKRKGYIFDAIRVAKDEYLIAINGYVEKTEYSYRRTGVTMGHPTDAQQGYIITTLDQLALINDYYITKAKALAQKEADEKNERAEKYYDTLSRDRRERHLNQKNFYNSLPAKVKKIITQADYEALSLEEKEKLYKPIKRYGPERLKAHLDDHHMWSSYHNMYERFINPEAVHPKPRTANPEVWIYWSTFRDMMRWKIKDIQVQREVDSEVRKIALETSFGESNTNDILKEQYGILVKRQNGTKIGPDEIEQIRKGWVLLNKTFGNLVENAKTDNLKISHTGQKYVFASKAAGMYVPSMKTIAVSNKFGDAQFDQIFAHETAHWIDHNMGTLTGKRHATDDFESTAGIISITFRKNMNAQSDSDYVNSTAECFARAMEQYFAFENYGEDAELLYSYGELKEVRTYHAEDKYVSKEKFNNLIKPLIKQFLAENQEWFKFGVPPIPEPTPETKTPSVAATLPPHLQALVDDPKVQAKFEELQKHKSYKVEDVTPAGYGPEEEPAPSIPEPKPNPMTTAIIIPHKEVRANQNIAIQEILAADSKFKDLKPMEAAMLYNLRDKENTDEVYLAKGLKEQIYKKLDEKFYLEQDFTTYTFVLSDKAKDFIEKVNSRIATRKGVKAGTDLFPETANIPEFVPSVITIPTITPKEKEVRKARFSVHECATRLGRLGGKASAKARAKKYNGGEVEDTDPHDGSDVSPDSTEYLIDMELKPLIDKVRKKAIRPESQHKFSDADILGMIVSKYNRWDGDKIKVTCASAFEDANYSEDAEKVSKFNEGGPTDSEYPPVKIIPFEKRKGWENYFFSNDANYALYANADKSYSVSVENMLPSPITGDQFITKAYKGFARNAVELEVSPQFSSTADQANTIAIDFMNKIDSKEIMKEGGPTCDCFHTYLEKERPELIEQMVSQDINSTPGLRTEVDKAYLAWGGGKIDKAKY